MHIPWIASDIRCRGLLDATNPDCVDWVENHNNGATGDSRGFPITSGSNFPLV